ncbi:histidine phosphatase family protein [Pleomorphomonas sp. PLEO]|uniref:histidine phosphatase family protein n=1 Tax=Pleomorphomonas sp. PLEO TaxID=3239306 RepID=UPI00351E941E
MAARLTLITVPTDNDRRAPRFPGRDRLDLTFESLPETVRRCLSEADHLIHAPEIAIGPNATVRVPAEVAEALSNLDYGNWANRTMTEIAGADPAGFEVWRMDMAAAPHGGEAISSARDRVGGWLAGLEERSGAIVALCPATIVRIALTAALEAPLSMIWRLDPMPWSACELTRHGDRWSLRLS